MPNYHRIYQPGGCYFFTITLQQRAGNDLLIRHINELRRAVSWVKKNHPFKVHAWVVLPDHLHCMLELPHNDSDYSKRIRLIKSSFSRQIISPNKLSSSNKKRKEKGIWQRRYWEHLIRDQRDYNNHMDYVHINPIKHELVKRVSDWPYSTFHALVERGLYLHNWGDNITSQKINYGE